MLRFVRNMRDRDILHRNFRLLLGNSMVIQKGLYNKCTVAEKYTHLLAFQISCSPSRKPARLKISPAHLKISPAHLRISPAHQRISPAHLNILPPLP